jgi:hypothetical protein
MVECDRQMLLRGYLEINKRRTVNILGEPPPGMGDGEPWRRMVDSAIGSIASDLGELLHRHGIDMP